MHNINNAKRTAPQRAKNRHGSNGPQNKLQVEIRADVAGIIRFADGHGDDGVGDHPGDDHVGAYGAVVVFLLLGLGDALGAELEAVAEVAEGIVVAGVDVELFRGHFELDDVALGADGGAEVDVDDVVAFGAPGDVVGVAEGVDL